MCHLSDNLVHARSLVFLGVVLNTAEQWSEALHSLSQAKALLKVLKNNANLAYAYQITAQVHYHQHQLQDAFAAVEEAWKKDVRMAQDGLTDQGETRCWVR